MTNTTLILTGLVGFISVSSFVYGGTPAMLVDKQVKFAVASVNGRIAWTKEEKDQLVLANSVSIATTPLVVVDYTPTANEVMLSTTVCPCKNYSEWIDIQDPATLQQKGKAVSEQDRYIQGYKSLK